MSLKNRLILLNVVSLVLVAVVISFVTLSKMAKVSNDDLSGFENYAFNSEKDKLKSAVNLATKATEAIYEKVKNMIVFF